jgi:hypothetical protein
VVYAISVVFFVCAYVAFVAIFFREIRESMKILQAHLVILQANGINPEHTPTRRKVLMLGRMMICGMLIFLAFVIWTVLALAALFPFWVYYLIDALRKGVTLGYMCWLCRVRSKMVALYGEGEEDYEIGDDEQGKEWTPGMVIPPLPAAAYSSDAIRAAPS